MWMACSRQIRSLIPAEIIPDITAAELLAMEMEDMVLEPRVVELMMNAKHVHEVKIINGHEPGNLRRAIAGERIGTVIRAV